MILIKRFENFSIRSEYEKSSPEKYYKTKSDEYENPHKERIQKCLDYLMDKINIGRFLDLSSGDGLVTDYLENKGYKDFKLSDPYFYDIISSKWGKEKTIKLSFEDISKFGLDENFDTIICSYALHLCEKSYLNNLFYQLSKSCNYFVVISPSKYPIIDETFFKIIDHKIIERSHIKIYKSIF